MSTRTSIYLPSGGPEDWRWLLASPEKHWRAGYSAMALADAWETADGWPSEVREAFDASDTLAGAELLLALPEHETPLRGGRRASQSDVFALARTRAGEQVAIAVEGKAEEPFGSETVGEWRTDGSPGKEERLAHLREVLELTDDESLAGVRYQLLHRTAAAVIEAERFGAAHAVMLVHSFSSVSAWFDDYAVFARALGARPVSGAVTPARVASGVELHLGWVTGEVRARSPHPEGVALTERFDRAVSPARTLHAGQRRKGTDIPYLAHLLAVAAVVLEDGGDEDEAIAALLHDAVEDQGGAPTLDRIRRLFGDRVAGIVNACSDTDVVPKPPWRERKETYIRHLVTADQSALRVSLADKLHNAQAILYDLREQGEELWGRFSTKSPDDQLWYYDELAKGYAERFPGLLAAELRRTVDEIAELAAPNRRVSG